MIEKQKRNQSDSPIGVIVPVYCVEEYLQRCIDSILTQTFTDFELILVDDGSPDNCGKICDEYAEKDSRVHVIHKENGGLSDARNAGIDWAFENSKSEWITFIDSDDWVHPSYLEMMLRSNEKNEAEISVCKIQCVTPKSDNCVYNDGEMECMTPEDFFCNRTRFFYSACGKVYKKELFRNIRFPYGRLNEDSFTIYKVIFSVDKVVFIDHALYFYFQSYNSIMRSNWTKRHLDDFVARREQIHYYKDNGFDQAYRHSVIDYSYTCLAQIKKCENENNSKGMKIVRRVLKKHILKYSLKGLYPFHKWIYHYEIAFPIEMQFYWYWQAIKRKLKRK